MSLSSLGPLRCCRIIARESGNAVCLGAHQATHKSGNVLGVARLGVAVLKRFHWPLDLLHLEASQPTPDEKRESVQPLHGVIYEQLGKLDCALELRFAFVWQPRLMNELHVSIHQVLVPPCALPQDRPVGLGGL